MSENPNANQPLSAGDILPPVEPPSAGFILQLFVVPGIIVVIIVMVWLVFNWVARTGNDPDEYVQALRRNNANRWQAAFGLASALKAHDAQGQALRKDAHLADELATILSEELTSGSTKDKEPVTLRAYLCQAPWPVRGDKWAARAAQSGLDPAQRRGNRSAAGGPASHRAAGRKHEGHQRRPVSHSRSDREIADRCGRLGSARPFGGGLCAGRDRRRTIPREVGIAAGRRQSGRAYNAATWLASQGDARAAPVLAEMLDPDELAGVNLEQNRALRENKRVAIIANALRAAGRLADKNHDVDLAPLETEIQKLLASSIDGRLKVEAGVVLKQLQAARPASGKTGKGTRASPPEN